MPNGMYNPRNTMSVKHVLVILILLALLAVVAPAGRSAPSGNAQVTYLNVGQGDSALLQDALGTDILIDGGPASAGANVVAYLRAHTDKNLEAVIVSHPDADHSAGVISVLQASDIAVAVIYYSGYPGATQTWANLVNQAAARSIPMLPAQFPAVYHWGEFDAYILNPASGLANPAPNDAAIVARVDFKASRFMFPADISSTIEATVVARQTPVASDVLKVGHHGSAYSSSPAFLSAVQPTYAVISVGANNSYGHPAAATLARLSSAGIQLWRTDQDGTISVTSDGASLQFPDRPHGGYTLFLPQVAKN